MKLSNSDMQIEKIVRDLFKVGSLEKIKQFKKKKEFELQVKEHELKQFILENYSILIKSIDKLSLIKDKSQELQEAFDKLSFTDDPIEFSLNNPQFIQDQPIIDFSTLLEDAWSSFDSLNETTFLKVIHLRKCSLPHQTCLIDALAIEMFESLIDNFMLSVDYSDTVLWDFYKKFTFASIILDADKITLVDSYRAATEDEFVNKLYLQTFEINDHRHLYILFSLLTLRALKFGYKFCNESSLLVNYGSFRRSINLINLLVTSINTSSSVLIDLTEYIQVIAGRSDLLPFPKVKMTINQLVEEVGKYLTELRNVPLGDVKELIKCIGGEQNNLFDVVFENSILPFLKSYLDNFSFPNSTIYNEICDLIESLNTSQSHKIIPLIIDFIKKKVDLQDVDFMQIFITEETKIEEIRSFVKGISSQFDLKVSQMLLSELNDYGSLLILVSC